MSFDFLAKMANKIKSLVSKSKKRYQSDGFDLDLTYITKDIIAMGFPAENFESVYRNNMEDVVRFLDKKHPGHYRVYNLCDERSYDPAKFHNRVATYPFKDHHPPRFSIIHPFCEDVDRYLSMDKSNVAVIHCKAGKGRTGVMICSYLIYRDRRSKKTAQDVLDYYSNTRTLNGKGVTIPSQIRYVKYYSSLINNNLQYKETNLLLRAIEFTSIPNYYNGSCTPYFMIRHPETIIYKSEVYDQHRKASSSLFMHLPQPTLLCGDVMIEFFNKPKMMKKEKMFHCWFNTFFVNETEDGINCEINMKMHSPEINPLHWDASSIYSAKSQQDLLSLRPCDYKQEDHYSPDSQSVHKLSKPTNKDKSLHLTVSSTRHLFTDFKRILSANRNLFGGSNMDVGNESKTTRFNMKSDDIQTCRLNNISKLPTDRTIFKDGEISFEKVGKTNSFTSQHNRVPVTRQTSQSRVCPNSISPNRSGVILRPEMMHYVNYPSSPIIEDDHDKCISLPEKHLMISTHTPSLSKSRTTHPPITQSLISNVSTTKSTSLPSFTPLASHLHFLVLTIPKMELDKANKDTQNKLYDSKFKVKLYFSTAEDYTVCPSKHLQKHKLASDDLDTDNEMDEDDDDDDDDKSCTDLDAIMFRSNLTETFI